MQNSNKDTEFVLTKDDFIQSGWKSYIAKKECDSYSDLWGAFAKAAREANESGDYRKEKVFWLLVYAASMVLRPDNSNEPFKPVFQGDGKRSTLPQDFSEDDLIYFENILPEIDNYMLKARIADLLWLLKKPRNFQFALIAIDNYIRFSLEPHKFVGDEENAWKRAINLSLQLGGGAKDRLDNIVKELFLHFQKAKYEDKFYALKIAKTLLCACLLNNQIEEITKKLESLGTRAIEDKNWWMVRNYLEKSIECYDLLDQNDDSSRIRVMIAESWVTEANDKPSHMIRGSFYENALHTYRQIPREDRSRMNVENRLDEIRSLMSEANRLSLDEMQKFKSGGIDIKDFVAETRSRMHEKKFPFVLRDFSMIANCVDYEQLKEHTKKSIELTPIQSIFMSTKFDSTGRVISRSPGLDFSNPDNPRNDLVLQERMIQKFLFGVQFDVEARILPALDVLVNEHFITLDELVSLCNESTFIPRDRVLLWAKGLLAGLEKDYVVSSHLLVPQLEHFTRIRLKIREENTSTIDSDGIENESGLSTLMDNPKVEEIFGKDLSFELKSLLTSHIGPNLRNQLAHGLLNDNQSMSYYAVYFWWLCLRLMVFSIPWMHPSDQQDQTDISQ